ncbi:tRNA1(Val) (adenine(37)-N6)-methyltransferase [Halalkalibacter sp. APA_J-10(15)]|uniref:tRNA1(Val) (adenine(37)-N6)-methyltransferase n=1 Tax=Halalkalibacter sp. APA_J-10(15) TaxID=2933805 RepID=UPI0024B7AFEE|nr:tRNA1(Val) (adenine(37)-N6)-methyltransferase [Halalkalibacter sp. APA_J-10(15)]
MKIELLEGERLDRVAGTELEIIQSRDVFSFSIDAILLSRFVQVPIRKGRILDLCSGNGVIPIALTTRTQAQIVGIEIQKRLVDMARRSVLVNQLEHRLSFVHENVVNIQLEGSFDVVTCNPPYFPTNTKRDQNMNEYVAIARHEIHCTLSDVIRVASRYVKHGGRVAFVHRPERLTDLLNEMRVCKIEPKRIQFVHAKPSTEANIVLVEGRKEGQPGVTCLPPIFVYNEEGRYNEAFLQIYEGEFRTKVGI